MLLVFCSVADLRSRFVWAVAAVDGADVSDTVHICADDVIDGGRCVEYNVELKIHLVAIPLTSNAFHPSHNLMSLDFVF